MKDDDAQLRNILRGVRKFISVVIFLLLLNEAFWYGLAWARVSLSARDSKAAIQRLSQSDPENRDLAAQAAVAPCAKYKTELIGFDYVVADTNIGKRVSATTTYRAIGQGMIVSRLVRDFTGQSASTAPDGGPWPVVSFTFKPVFVAYQ